MNSKLYLEINHEHGKSQITDLYFTAPYKIMSPFYEKDCLEVTLMSASAGMLSGDCFDGTFFFGEGTRTRYHSQSYEKVFRSKGDVTKKNTHITVEEGAMVSFMPYPVIPFAGSYYISDTQIHLKETSTLLYGDIFTCGRSGMGEYFQMKRYESKTKVFVENQLVFADHTDMNPNKFSYPVMGMWETGTHNGMLYLYVGDTEKENLLLSQVRELGLQQTSLQMGASRCQRGILVRVLGTRGDDIYKFFQQIEKIVT